jgi:excisionase family DNA binding protein
MRSREMCWTVDEVAALTRLPRLKIYRMVHEGTIPYFKEGEAVRFRPAEVRRWWDQWVKSQCRQSMVC